MPHDSSRLDVVGMARSFVSPALLPRSPSHPAANVVGGDVRQGDSVPPPSFSLTERGEIAVVQVVVQISGVDGSSARGRGRGRGQGSCTGSCEPALQVFVTVFPLPRLLTNSVRACASS